MKRCCENLCPHFQSAMEVLARPWTGFILATLEEGPLRFSVLGERIPDIADKMLSSRLKELELEGVLVRRVRPGPPVRVEYELTEVGHGFRAVYDAIATWGQALAAEHIRKTGAPG